VTGLVRKLKARLLGRRGPPVIQPYRDLVRLLRKDAVVAHSASWLFRVTPYLVFTAIWLGASLIPTFTTNLLLGPTADLIALVALLGSARFFTALAGLDVGTSFGGIGASREMMIASLAEPAMLMVIFTVSLLIGSTSLSVIADYLIAHPVGVRVSLGLGLIALMIVAIAENARVPVDNPATHLELTMVHEAMILEYSGRHLALMEAAAMLKLLLYISLIACIFLPFGMAQGDGVAALSRGLGSYLAKLLGGVVILALFETSLAKMRVFRVSEFLAAALLLGLLAMILLYVTKGL
jgi:formate hydrogenlyase subunit 4